MSRASRLAVNALALAAGFALSAGALYGTGTVRDLPPCATEDSTGCYWDADTQGNGEGVSLWTP